MDPKAEEIAREIIGNVRDSLKAAAKDFLDQQADAKAFLEERARRAAELVLEYARAKEDDRAAIRQYMDIVRQSITNEALAVALGAEAAAKGAFLSVLGSVFQFALKNLPTILAVIPK